MSDLTELHRSWFAALDTELEGALEVRRRLHADPHLSGQEEPTSLQVEAALGIPMQRIAETGRFVRTGPSDGPSVLLRAELDALPVTEATGVAFASPTGRMHACGHDVHLAALVAVVRAAAGLDLPLGLLAVLQPREESYPSGALDVIGSGLITDEQVSAAIGAHVHPGVPPGQVATGAGVVNAAADEIEIVLTGDGGHGAYPEHAADPVAALGHIVLGLPEVVRHTVSPMRPATVSVGHVQAGEPSANVLPSQARLLATMRTTDARDREALPRQVRRLAEHQAMAYGVHAEVRITAGEPVLYNDPDLVDRVDAWLEHTGVEPTEPMRSLGADDFSFFGELVPSVMCFVGVRVAGHQEDPTPLHHPRFLPVDEAVGDVARALVAGYLAAVELHHRQPPTTP
ncbi:amidohydrolase [Ornithinimicrobium ciconiae]|uniref:Amidohydrolase n=1 Tax=Ornithinimicrobium ciconiae TaxID=2594265 RepID=A0A516GD36_9MICO|nr:M20 family metallopeptidase [Ornithinimicrobium ciconiae]QDO89435.1 amidohydrolase [Ornithinimicrobium ciconiae]